MTCIYSTFISAIFRLLAEGDPRRVVYMDCKGRCVCLLPEQAAASETAYKPVLTPQDLNAPFLFSFEACAAAPHTPIIAGQFFVERALDLSDEWLDTHRGKLDDIAESFNA